MEEKKKSKKKMIKVNNIRDYTNKEYISETKEYFGNSEYIAPGLVHTKEELINKIKSATLEYLSLSSMKEMHNTDVGEILNAGKQEDMIRVGKQLAEEYERDWDSLVNAINDDKEIPPPIVLRDVKGKLVLMGGNTRLMVYTSYNKHLPVKIIDYDKEFDFKAEEQEFKQREKNMVRKIITENTKGYYPTILKEICEPCESVEEGEKIAVDLLNTLTEHKSGIGLAANQIGINKRVCVVHIPKREPLIFINPRIVSKEQEITGVPEACLSFPGETVTTTRYSLITVEADNWEEDVVLGPMSEDRQESTDELWECIATQHEIDHLNGKTMYDRELKREPIRRESRKIGRNEKVEITNGTDTKTIKYKKIEPFLLEGWRLVGEEQVNV